MEPTLEELFEQFKKLPDWDRYPMPEVFYSHFNVKKPQPATVNEVAFYTPPAHLPLGDGKVELRGPAEGGVRQLELPEPLPVETLVIKDDAEKEQTSNVAGLLTDSIKKEDHFTIQNADDKSVSSGQN